MGILPGFGASGVLSNAFLSSGGGGELTTPNLAGSLATQGASSSTTTITLNYSGIAQAGDLLLAVAIHEGSVTTHTWPAGWTRQYPVSTGNYSLATAIYSSGSSVSVSLSSSRTYRGGFVWAFRNINAAIVFSNYIGQNTTTSFNNLGSLSLNTSDQNQDLSWLGVAFAFDYNNTDSNLLTVTDSGVDFETPDLTETLTSSGSAADYQAILFTKTMMSNVIDDGPTWSKSGTSIPIFAWQGILLPQGYQRGAG